MRISDWSSDVCSSDPHDPRTHQRRPCPGTCRRADRRTTAQARRQAASRNRRIRHLRSQVRCRDGTVVRRQRTHGLAPRRRAPPAIQSAAEGTGMKRGHDMSGDMKFAPSPAWGEILGEALGDNLGLAMEAFDFEADELADIVGDHWAGVLWGCAFEDLLTRTIQPARNIDVDYLRPRGWNERAQTQIYMRDLHISGMNPQEDSAAQTD